MSYLEDEEEAGVHRLEGSTGTEKGGLVIMKKGPSADADKHVFLAPSQRPSILGLDRLAALKRKQQEEEREKKKSRVSSYKDEEEEEEEVEDSEQPGRKGHSSKDRYTLQLNTVCYSSSMTVHNC